LEEEVKEGEEEDEVEERTNFRRRLTMTGL